MFRTLPMFCTLSAFSPERALAEPTCLGCRWSCRVCPQETFRLLQRRFFGAGAPSLLTTLRTFWNLRLFRLLFHRSHGVARIPLCRPLRAFRSPCTPPRHNSEASRRRSKGC
ncbi:hypothetical protein EDB89DRAFT_1151585 [Lactarius sanguifluus]|nr:hypothetical protein EDB89DRAFT_1151585 [Lactarius sanguifluus]